MVSSSDSMVMITSSSEKSCCALEKEIAECEIKSFHHCHSAHEAQEFMNKFQYCCIVIDPPLLDESGFELAITACENTLAGVVFLSPSYCMKQMEAELTQYGIAVIEKNSHGSELPSFIQYSVLMSKRLVRIRKENIRLKTMVSDIKMVDRAKCVLMEYLGMTEAAAHHYIEKLAMDSNRTKSEVARSIIATYES